MPFLAPVAAPLISAGIGFLGNKLSGGGGGGTAGPSNYQKTAWNQLNAMGEVGKNYGGLFLGNAADAYKAPTNYYSSLLSGNPSAVGQATLPERQQLASSFGQARQQLDQFAPMGGGRAALYGQLPFQQASAISNLISQARQNAASGLTNIAGQQGSLGTSALNAGASAAGQFGSLAGGQNQFGYNAGANAGGALGNILAGLNLGGIFGGR